MVYIVESSIALHKCSNFSKLKNFVFKQSHKKNCDFVYDNYELEGKAYSEQKNYCIITTEFAHDHAEDCVAFLRTMRETVGIIVECVYSQGGPVKILFASKHYQTMMRKDSIRDYKKISGQKNYTDGEEIIVAELYNINRTTFGKNNF